MSLYFINDHGVCGLDVKQDGSIIGWIRYSKLYGYSVAFEECVTLDIEEMTAILNKMTELDRKIKKS